MILGGPRRRHQVRGGGNSARRLAADIGDRRLLGEQATGRTLDPASASKARSFAGELQRRIARRRAGPVAGSAQAVPAVNAPPPPGLQTDLLEQNDLQLVPGEVGIRCSGSAKTCRSPAHGRPAPGGGDWSYPAGPTWSGGNPCWPRCPGRPPSGPVRTGTVYAGYAPAGDFALTVDGRSVRRQPAFGWAAQFATTPGRASLSYSQFPYVPLAVLAEVAVWVVLAALVGRRRRPPPARTVWRAT